VEREDKVDSIVLISSLRFRNGHQGTAQNIANQIPLPQSQSKSYLYQIFALIASELLQEQEEDK
jgi:hypothetical protein